MPNREISCVLRIFYHDNNNNALNIHPSQFQQFFYDYNLFVHKEIILQNLIPLHSQISNLIFCYFLFIDLYLIYQLLFKDVILDQQNQFIICFLASTHKTEKKQFFQKKKKIFFFGRNFSIKIDEKKISTKCSTIYIVQFQIFVYVTMFDSRYLEKNFRKSIYSFFYGFYTQN